MNEEEILKEIQELKASVSKLENEINRVVEYINDIFLYLTNEKQPSKKQPSINELFAIYDNLNTAYNFGNSIPLPLFKDEILKKYDISENEIDKLLLELDKKGIIYLQTLDNKNDFKDSNRGIDYKGRLLYFITWIK